MVSGTRYFATSQKEKSIEHLAPAQPDTTFDPRRDQIRVLWFFDNM